MIKLEPFISICIPTYNRSEYLSDSISSAINQNYLNYEIVIVDDGSTDNTEGIICSFQNEKIRYIKKVHTNAPDTRNRALKEAKGEFVLWLDDDDIIHPQTLETYVKYINEYTNVDIFYCKIIAFSNFRGDIGDYTYNDWYDRQDEIIQFLIFGQPIPNGGSLIRKVIYDDVGGYNLDYLRAHDYEFYTRVFLKKKYNLKYIDEYLLRYRIHEKNITLNITGKIDLKYEAMILRKLICDYELSLFFPQLKKIENFKKSLAEVYYILGIKFFNYRAYSDSIFYLSSSLREDRNLERLNHSIQGFIDSGAIEELKIYLFMVKELFEENTELKKVIEIIDNYKE